MAPTVYTGGTFDCFHAGHASFLRQCAEVGEVVVGLNSDEFATRYKRQPVFTYEERRQVLIACRWVANIVANIGDEDSRPAIASVGPDFIAHGDDWTGEALMEQMGLTDEWLDELGIEMLYVPYTPGVSTSDVIKRVILSSLEPA